MLMRQVLRVSRTARIQHVRHFMFAPTSKKYLSSSAQQAVWATIIMQRIQKCHQSLPQNYGSKTIAQLIEEIQLPNNSIYGFDEINKKQVTKIFTQGIKLNHIVFNQSRVYQTKSKKNSHVHYFPTFIVSPQIYEALQQTKQISMLIYGGFGISKTFSLIFYKILSEYKTKFWMQAKKLESKSDQKKQLVLEGLLNDQCWKYWYWTVNAYFIEEVKKSNSNTQDILKTTIRTILLQQAVQLSDKQKNKLRQIGSFSKFKQLLKSHYKNAGIQSRTIIDQINGVASKMRQCNAIKKVRLQQQKRIKQQRDKLILQDLNILNKTNEQKKYFEQQYNKLDNEKRISIEKYQNQKFYSWIEPTTKILSLVESFKQMGISYIFNSSLNIQIDLLQNDEKDTLFSFKSKNGFHQKFRIQYIEYQEKLKQNWGKIDFCKFFQNQFLKQLDDYKVSQNKQQKIRQYLRKLFQTFMIHTYYRPLFITEFLSVQNNSTNMPKTSQKYPQLYQKRKLLLQQIYSNKCDQQRTPVILSQLMNLFKYFCQERCAENLQRFIYNKGSPDQIAIKKKFIMFLTHIAQLKNQEKDQRMRLYKVDFNRLFKLLGFQINEFLDSRLHNKEFLPFKPSGNYIQFAWSTQQFLQIAQTLIYQDINTFISEFWTQACKKQLSQNQSLLGLTFQIILLEALQQQSQITLKFFSENKENQDFVSLKLKKRLPFRPFNQNYKDNQGIDKLDNLKQLKIAADKNPNQCIIGLPMYNNKHDPKSVGIDFMILRHSQLANDSFYELFVFDPTVSFQTKAVNGKFNKTKDLMQSIKQSFEAKNLKCKLIYAPICLRDFCKQLKEKNKDIRFTCASIEDIYITSKQKEKYLSFRLIQNLVTATYQQHKKQQIEKKVVRT